MAGEQVQKRRELQARLGESRLDIARHDEASVWICGEGVLTLNDLEALIYLMRERGDWTLTEEGDE